MTVPDPIRVLLTDDHPVVRKGIIHVLESSPELKVVGEAESGEEALFLCQKLKPDVVIMDVQMDGIGGMQATSLILQQNPDVAVMGLSTFPQADTVQGMLDAGARGYLLKDIGPDELIAAIQAIHKGEIVLSPDLEKQSAQSVCSTAMSGRQALRADIGPQQKKVLLLMTKGFTNPEIAEQLSISTPTARYHVSAIFQKLDVSNRAEAVALAIRENLVSGTDI